MKHNSQNVDIADFPLDKSDGGGSSDKRRIAMTAMFGPAITSDATARAAAMTLDETSKEEQGDRRGRKAIEHEATTEAVHSAVSTLLMRQFPESIERRGLDHALEEWDDGYGMQDSFPRAGVYLSPAGQFKTLDQHLREERQAHLRQHREAMVASRYTVTLGQALETLLPHMDALDITAQEMFKARDYESIDRSYGQVWRMLVDQDSHWEHFSGIMSRMHYTTQREKGESNLHQLPNDVYDDEGSFRGGYDDIYNLNFVMTEADVRRIFSEPIARAFHENTTRNGKLKKKFLPESDANEG